MKHVMMIANDTTFLFNLRREILEQLVSDGYKVTVVAQVIHFKTELEQIGCTIIDIQTARQGKNPLQDIALFRNYFDVIKKAEPDVVLSNNIKPNVYAGIVCQLLKVPYIVNITGLGTAVEYSSALQPLTVHLYKIGVAGASCILFQNYENRIFFKQHKMMPKHAAVRILPGSGVNLQTHPVLPYPNGDVIHFQFTSRILKEKGIDLYLAAATKIHALYPNTMFHICGGCDDKKYVKILERAQEKKYIIYHGQQSDMTPFLMQASCIVHPSYYPEGMSNVLLEGAASARPIIASNRSGCRETVDDGVSGFLVPIKDEDALTDALNRFIQMSLDMRKAMGLAGRKKMEQEFDRKLVVQAYKEEITRILGA